jgi:pimeloyl-ACP methyl ester carboxylesterase
MLDHAQSFLVPAPSAQLQVRVAGAGPAVVLLPGMGRPSSDLDPLATRLVEAGYRVLLPQPRGLSPSTGRLDGLTFHDFAADIACVIEHVCADKGAPVVVIGHAIGNRIARTLAADRPDLVRLVVLLTSSGRVQPAPDIAAAMRIGLRSAAGSPRWPGSDRAGTRRLGCTAGRTS